MGDTSQSRSQRILTTCDICGDVASREPIYITDLQQGLQRSCDLCQILYEGIEAWKRTLTEEDRQALRKLEFLHFEPFNTTDTYFKFVLCPTKTLKGGGPFSCFEIFQDTPNAADLSPGRKSALPQDVPTKLEIPHIVSVFNEWSENCDLFHPECSVASGAQLPKRVLDVSSREDEVIKLKELNGICAPYIALSYCWGPSAPSLRTTSTTLAQHLRGVPLHDFPTLFKDAIAICRALEVRYLWIDALSIIQDSTEDWEMESAKMAQIYSNSCLVIAASSCADTTGSLFSDRWTSIRVHGELICRTKTGSVAISSGRHTFRLRPELHEAHHRFQTSYNLRRHALDAPLLTRAWAFQERLLPPRTLHFDAEELIWECNTGMRCECGVIDDPDIKAAEYYSRPMINTASPPHLWLKTFIPKVEPENVTHGLISSMWTSLLSAYSGLVLTYESDRLPALSGLVARFTQQSLGEYVAGIWTGMIPLALLYESRWESGDFDPFSSYKPQAPTWSWASIPFSGANTISYDHAKSNFKTPCSYFNVLYVSAKVLGKNPFGWVKNAALSVRGLTAKCLTVDTMNGMALKIGERGPRLIPEGDESLIMLLPDREVTITQIRRLLLLYLGSGFGLALQSQKESGEPRTYRRVGLAIWNHPTELWKEHWEHHLEIRELILV